MNLQEELTKMDQTQFLFGKQILQSHASLLVYEKLLNEHHVDYICEIGTACGALAAYFGMRGYLEDVPVMTIDNGAADWAWPIDTPTLGLLMLLGVRVIRRDCFSSVIVPEITTFLSNGKGLLFCDGGNKAKEVNTFAKVTKPGSLVIVHDFGFEVHDDDIPRCLYPLEPYHSQALSLGTKAGVFVRNNNNQ